MKKEIVSSKFSILNFEQILTDAFANQLYIGIIKYILGACAIDAVIEYTTIGHQKTRILLPSNQFQVSLSSLYSYHRIKWRLYSCKMN